jgi:uncharacterized protein with PQ loop repeat
MEWLQSITLLFSLIAILDTTSLDRRRELAALMVHGLVNKHTATLLIADILEYHFMEQVILLTMSQHTGLRSTSLVTLHTALSVFHLSSVKQTVIGVETFLYAQIPVILLHVSMVVHVSHFFQFVAPQMIRVVIALLSLTDIAVKYL